MSVSVLAWSSLASAEEKASAFPPPDYFVTGGALVAEGAVSPGDVCPSSSKNPCILGGGGGLAIRAGYRSNADWYLGGAYEFSRHDASNLLVLPILQQIRFEARRYFVTGTTLEFVLDAGAGLVLYGSEWRADTVGLGGSFGGGVELQPSPGLIVGLHLLYRPILLRGWVDSVGQDRAGGDGGVGLAHFCGLELVLELQNPLPRW